MNAATSVGFTGGVNAGPGTATANVARQQNDGVQFITQDGITLQGVQQKHDWVVWTWEENRTSHSGLHGESIVSLTIPAMGGVKACFSVHCKLWRSSVIGRREAECSNPNNLKKGKGIDFVMVDLHSY
jgi:hypothetical protein